MSSRNKDFWVVVFERGLKGGGSVESHTGLKSGSLKEFDKSS